MHRLTALCVRHPWLTLLVAVAAAVTAARATLRTELSVGMDSTLGGEHPVLREFDAFLERFGGGYPVLIAYECERPAPCEGALDSAALDPGQLALALLFLWGVLSPSVACHSRAADVGARGDLRTFATSIPQMRWGY